MALETRDAYRMDFLFTALHGDRWEILQSLAAKAKEVERRQDLADEIIRGVLEDEAAFQKMVQIGALPIEDAELALRLAASVAEQARREEAFHELGHVVHVHTDRGAYECLCGASGPAREAGIHLLRVNASAVDVELSRARNAGVLRLRGDVTR